MVARKNRTQFISAIVIFLALVAILVVPELITDYLWFTSLDFEQIFVINIEAKLFLFFVSGFIFLAFLILNLWLGKRHQKPNQIKTRTLGLIGLIISIFVARFAASRWDVFLRYLRQVPFGTNDPVFMKDISFYIFSLPFFEFVWTFGIITIGLTLLFMLGFYFQSIIASFVSGNFQTTPGDLDGTSQRFNFKKELNKLKNKAKVHISFLVALLFFAIAIGHYLSRYSILYAERGAVVGAGYTQINAQLPILNVLVFLAIALGVMALAAGFLKFSNIKSSAKYFVYVLVVYLLLAGLGLSIIPSVVQSLVVSPNEFNLEKPYIEDNINYTLNAYNLGNVEQRSISFEQAITQEMLNRNKETVNNIRILDWRPLTQTYKQTQEIRLYYDLSGIDIGRYNINDKYTQVMLAPRELNQNQLQQRAKTWVNKHLVFTHGYGAVMSPVNNVTSEGLPKYLIKDIPPVTTVNESSIEIERPQIYYGEQYSRYVIANSNTPEFDYPKGDTNEYINYDGEGGVQLDSFLKKLLMAIRFWDIKILLSSAVDEDSKIMFHRHIQDRISRVTPFLMLDSDPYLVINNGKLYWMQDAYTVTDKYPYSERTGRFNYIRNPVKIVVDAYNGDIEYYMVNKDPIMETYSNIYPNEFKRFDEMPAGLKDHIRYPEELFKIQSSIYSTYHMKDPNVFYNKEDAWEIPNEIYGTGQRVKVEPYYIIMKLPGQDETEFILMTSFTPTTKDNMISWMAARSDEENYGEILLYKYPKDRLVYGPSQVEATIDQDSEISQQLTLWSQRGSSVTRGNLLVIPIEDSVLYVEPLYLQSEQGQLPQLKRVIVSDGNQVVMEETLQEALGALFEGEQQPVVPSKPAETFEELVNRANEEYNDFLNSIQDQNWAEAGESIDKLGKTLEQLKN